jgi:hypothetical protein
MHPAGPRAGTPGTPATLPDAPTSTACRLGAERSPVQIRPPRLREWPGSRVPGATHHVPTSTGAAPAPLGAGSRGRAACRAKRVREGPEAKAREAEAEAAQGARLLEGALDRRADPDHPRPSVGPGSRMISCTTQASAPSRRNSGDGTELSASRPKRSGCHWAPARITREVASSVRFGHYRAGQRPLPGVPARDATAPRCGGRPAQWRGPGLGARRPRQPNPRVRVRRLRPRVRARCAGRAAGRGGRPPPAHRARVGTGRVHDLDAHRRRPHPQRLHPCGEDRPNRPGLSDITASSRRASPLWPHRRAPGRP